MKYSVLILALLSAALYSFDIQAVDLTKEGKEKSALPYTVAKDGKKIYKDIGKTIKALTNQSIEPMLNQALEPMDVVIIYPIDSNKTHTPSTVSEKNKKIEVKDDIIDVFAEINANKESKIEAINNENKKIKLNNEAKKIIPVNLEK